MQPLDLSFTNDPNTLAIALIGGMVPALLWLFFWLREDSDHKKPAGLLIMTFIAGMFAVILVLPVEKTIAGMFTDNTTLTILWAASEEIMKYLAVAAIALRSSYLTEPVDYAIFFMTAALGFAALENALFLIHPLTVNNTTVSFLTGNLRYFGATLLHSASTGLVGIGLGLAYFKPKATRTLYGFCGMVAAITLHSVFNFFIIQKNGENIFQVFGFLWVVTIIIMLLFEKLRRLGSYTD